MGNEYVSGTKIDGLKIPVFNITSSQYFSAYMIANMTALDEHDHSTGKGTALSQNSILFTSDFDLQNYGLTKVNYIKYVNPTSYATSPGLASTYFMNGDFYIIDGSGNVVQLTKLGGLNSTLVGGFTGEYASSGTAFCVFRNAANEYEFHKDTHVLSNVIVGSLGIRSTTSNKDTKGITLQTTGNIATSYVWTVPDAQATNVSSVLSVDSNGSISYIDTTSFIRTTGDQTKAGVLTLSSYPVITDTNTISDPNQVPRKSYVDGLDGQNVKITGDQSIAGTKTFTTANPRLFSSTPSNALDAASKGYVDSLDSSNVHLSGDETVNGVKTLGSFPVLPSATPLTSLQAAPKGYVDSYVQSLTINGVPFGTNTSININPPANTNTSNGEYALRVLGSNLEWVPNSGGSFPEAPVDSKQYVRKNGAWSQASLTLGGMGGVSVTTPTANQSLVYNSNTSNFENNTLTLAGLGDVTSVSPITGQSLVYDSNTSKYMNQTVSSKEVSVDVTANSKGITAGNVVEIVSDGVQDIQNIYYCEAPTIGSLATLDGTNNCSSFSIAAGTSSNALIAYEDSSNIVCRIIQVGSPPTAGTKLILTSGSRAPVISRLSDTTFATVSQTSASNIVTSVVTTSGTNQPIKSTDSSGITATIAVTPATCALTSSNWFVGYNETTNNGRIILAQANGTNAPLISTVGSFASTTGMSISKLTSNTVGVLSFSSVSGIYLQMAYFQGNGTNTPTQLVAPTENIAGTDTSTYLTSCSMDSNHILFGYNDATVSNGVLSVATFNGTNAITIGSKAIFSTTAVSYTSLTQQGTNTALLAWTDSSNKRNSVVISWDSNYNLTLSQINSLNGATNTAYNAVAALSPTQALAAFQSGGSIGKAGTLTLTPTPVISGQLLGIATTSATNGASASVAVGPVYGTTGLTQWADYYVNPTGGISTNMSTVHVGKATSTTALELGLRGAPEAGKQIVWEILVPGSFSFTTPYKGNYEILACGGGGSGGYSNAMPGGNGGNTIKITKPIFNGIITGSIGAGGVSQTNNSAEGNDGTATTITISNTTFTADGGLGARLLGSTNGNVFNRPNNPQIDAYLGTPGSRCSGSNTVQIGGVSMLTLLAATSVGDSTGTAGTRGGGGTSDNNSASGAGGDGVCRITLTIGS